MVVALCRRLAPIQAWLGLIPTGTPAVSIGGCTKVIYILSIGEMNSLLPFQKGASVWYKGKVMFLFL